MLNLAGIKIEGTATSGIASAITLPEMGICLDLGVATPEALRCDTVLITHGHLDHFYGIVRHAYIRHLTGATTSRFVCQRRLAPLIREMFRVIRKFQRGRNPRFEIITIEPGEEVRLKRDLVVRAFKTHHKIDSQGYVLVRQTQRLKPEFGHLKGSREGGLEIARLRRTGVQVTNTFEVPFLAYTGDTKASVFDVRGPLMDQVRKAKVLVTECTFLGEGHDAAFAQKRGHIHMDELGDRADRLENEAVLLVHFSQRYSNRQIERAMKDLPEPLRAKAHYLPLNAGGMSGSSFEE